MPAACRALCGLLCLTLWAWPERADEVPGTTGARLGVISNGVQIADQEHISYNNTDVHDFSYALQIIL